MLKHVTSYHDELIQAFRNTWFNEHFKFYSSTPYFEDYTFETNTKSKHQFVILDPKTDKVIGYLGYNFERDQYKISNISVINFMSDPKLELESSERIRYAKIVSNDLRNVFISIWNHPDFRLLEFYSYKGNPALAKYLKFIKRWNGICSGIRHQSFKLSDGYYYDEIIFQIFKDIEKSIPSGLETIRQVSDMLIAEFVEKK